MKTSGNFYAVFGGGRGRHDAVEMFSHDERESGWPCPRHPGPYVAATGGHMDWEERW